MTDLQNKLAALDAFLTRKDWRTVCRTAQTGHTIEFIDRDAYYLSDGGYSRVCIRPGDNDVEVFLSSVSRDEVKERWKFCKELVEDVRTAARNEYKRLGWW